MLRNSSVLKGRYTDTKLQPAQRRKYCVKPNNAIRDGLAPLSDTFYDILGVDPTADAAKIKRSYYGLVKECHPDLSTDDDSAEFCILVNEIYETLTDPVRRSIYDELIGIAHSPVNPFLDVDADRNEAFVDEFACIGCRNCTCLCPKTFAIEEDFGRARAHTQGADPEQDIQDAIDSCPVSCIHWVSAPQRRLLEQAMSRMDRVPVWALMSGSGANINVFVEASNIWERQQADLQAEMAMEANTAFWQGMSWTGPGYDFRSSSNANGGAANGQDSTGASTGRGMAASVATLASRASVAVTKWKQYQAEQRVRQPQKTLL